MGERGLRRILLVVNALTGVSVSCAAFLYLSYRFSAFSFSLTFFAVANAVVGKVLKVLLKDRRPHVDDGKSTRHKTYGFPSSHANSLSFFASFLTVASFLPENGPAVLSLARSLFLGIDFSHRCPAALALSCVMIVYTFAVCYTRVEITGHHTWKQVGFFYIFIGG